MLDELSYQATDMNKCGSKIVARSDMRTDKTASALTNLNLIKSTRSDLPIKIMMTQKICKDIHAYASFGVVFLWSGSDSFLR